MKSEWFIKREASIKIKASGLEAKKPKGETPDSESSA